jgi:RNA polymerase sigma factor (TIGR02999 family)
MKASRLSESANAKRKISAASEARAGNSTPALCQAPRVCGNVRRLQPAKLIHSFALEGLMETPSTEEITQLLVAWNQGDAAALEQLTPLVHGELHRLAKRYMAGERQGHILQTTALVNEAWLRLIDWQNVEWQNRAHFFGLAARIMRAILVDFARARDREKRGGDEIRVSLSEAANVALERSADFVALDDALQALEKMDPRQARVVELKFFAGLTNEEAAEALKVSVGTVRRDWSLAEAWLFRELNPEEPTR